MKYEIKPLTEEEESLIEEKISAYADSMAPKEPHTEEEQLVFKITDGEKGVIGGCIVNIHSWGRAVLAQLWVDEGYRGQGLGSLLIRRAERAAREKGCYYMCLGTLDFHARGLYEKHGYRVFTVNRDFPRGHEGYSMSKRLDREIPAYVPKNNGGAARYTAEPGGKEDAGIIGDGLERYGEQFVRDEHGDIPLGKKLVDADGRLIAGVIASVGCWDDGEIDGVWVEEAYRKQGLGAYLLGEVEREAKENGAYILFTNACGWNAGFFGKCGYSVRGELEDYPKGHRAYELEKRL